MRTLRPLARPPSAVPAGQHAPRLGPLLLAALLLAMVAPAARAADPVQLDVESRPVTRFLAPLGSSSPAERARQARERVEALPHAATDQPVTTAPFQFGDQRGVAVLAGGRLIFTVLEADLDPAAGDQLQPTAAAAAERLGVALQARRDQRSIPLLLRAAGASAGATALLALLLWLLVRLRRGSVEAVASFAQHRARKLVSSGLDPAPLVASAARGLLHLITWLVAALLLDAWLTFVLSRFPATAPWADALTGQVLGIIGTLGLELLRAVPGLVGVALIVVVTRALSSFLSGLFDRVAAGTLRVPGLYPETIEATRRIAQAVLWLAALAAAYPYLPGSNSEAVKGLSLLLGVMVSLGSSGIMAQAMSGLVVVYSRSLSVGDSIRAGAVEGVVSEVGLLSTKLITLRGEEVTLPNNVLVSAGVKNFSRLNGGEGALLTTSVTIGYDAPWRQVEALLLAAATGTPGLHAEVHPYVLQRSLSDFYVSYELVARLERPIDRPQVLSVLHGRIQDAFNQAGVQIMSPHFKAQPPSPVLGPPPTGGGHGTARSPADPG
jgi:small-conductance mechanosensitive channel